MFSLRKCSQNKRISGIISVLKSRWSDVAIPRVAGEKRVGNESLAAAGGNEWLRALGILASGPLGQPEGARATLRGGPCEALLLPKDCVQ